MTPLRPSTGGRLVGLLLALVAGVRLLAAEAPSASRPPDPGVAEQLAKTLVALDDPDFAVRVGAVERLEQWVDRPELGMWLAGEFARAMLSSDSSIEVRTRLDLLSRKLPTVQPLDTQASAAEIIPLMDQLDSDSSAVRDNAERRLRSMLGRADLVCPLMLETKHRLADGRLTVQTRHCLEPLLDLVREAWALADSRQMILPDVSADEMARWLDDLTCPEPLDSQQRFRRALAQRELTDLVVRDDSRPILLPLVERRVAIAEDEKLQLLLDFAKPGMAAEVWSHQGLKTRQYLTIGVPQINDQTQRATHFDRIDDHTAHCVTGNSLSEGDYPVGVAIPHPDPGQEMIFQLINLPTPRRRLAYEYQAKRDEATRLAELGERTVAEILATKRVLGETHVLMLAQLEPSAVSKFVGPYFDAVPNQPIFTTTNQLAGQITLHGAICFVMARIGTHEAVPAMEQTARSGRLGKPSYESPYSMAWVAALAIAARDPWPEIDDWLASLVDVDTLVVARVDSAPEVGASAAAMLLERQGMSPRAFGLELAGEQAVVELLRFAPYRFTASKHREDVKRWWEKHQKTASDERLAP